MPKETLGREPTRDQRELSPEEVLGRRTGDGPFRFEGGPAGCLLIHGLTGTPEEMRYLGDRLHRHMGFTVSGVLLAGHGADASAFQERGWPDWYRSAEQGMLELAGTCSPVFVAGFSLGGLIAMALALRHGTTVDALALLATPLFNNRYKARLVGTLYGMPGVRAWLRRQWRQAAWEAPPLRKNLMQAERSSAELKWLLRRKGACLTHPTLILHSRRDPSVCWENAIALSNLISSPRKGRVLLTRSQHVLPLDLDRDQVADAIGRFFLSC
jgi:carboxylesterase